MPSSSSPERDIAARAILAALLVCAVLPVLVTPIPAMVDYPNHLARMAVLARAGAPEAQPFYELRWALYPNLAMDIVVPPLGRLIGVELALRLFLLLSQVLVVAGATTLERVVKGRVAIAGFVAVLFLYSMPFAWGFVNFEFGLGLALFGIAAMLALEERGWAARLACHAAFAAALFAAHLFALGVYGFALGLRELWRFASGRSSARALIGRLALLALPAVLLAAAMVASGGSAGGEGTEWVFVMKPYWLFYILGGYSLTASIVGVVVLTILVYCLAKRGALRFAPSGAWMAAGFGLLYLAMPTRLLDTSFVDMRVLVAAALILPAFVTVHFPDAFWRRTALAAVALVAAAQIAVTAFVWLDYRATYDAMRRSFAQLGKGAHVLIGHSGTADDPPLGNLADYPAYGAPVLAVSDADAFVPNFYAAKGKQPVAVVPALERLSVPHAGPVPAALLVRIAEAEAPAGTPSFLQSWTEDYDYLYMLGPEAPNPLPDRLEKIAEGRRFVLYRVGDRPGSISP